MVRALRDRCIEATILTLAQAGEVVFIPRITLINDGPHNTLPVQLKRLQFPVCLAFAMTMNKSQGQTVPRVGDYLPEPVFAHGQLYVAVSRVQARANIRILALNSKSNVAGRTYTKNIVYDEVLDEIDRTVMCTTSS